jgi:OOP family OmpA-OmpF porin
MKKIVISVTTVLALSVTSHAGGKNIVPVDAQVAAIPPKIVSPIPLYVGLGVVAAGLSRDCPCEDGSRLKDTTYGGLVRAGWDVNQYFGLEARGLKTSWEKDFSQTKHYGVFLKPQYHVMDQVNIYGLLGYGKTTIDYSNGRRSSTLSEKGLSFGVGMEYDFSTDDTSVQYSRAFDGQGDQEEGWGVWIDYQNLLVDEGTFGTDTNIVSIGITYDF